MPNPVQAPTRYGKRLARTSGVFAGRAVRRLSFLKRARFGGVELATQFAANRRIQFSPTHPPALPYRVDQRVQHLPGLPQFGSRYAAKRSGAVLGLVVAAYKIPARVAAPERQAPQVRPVRVDLAAVRQPSVDVAAATAAVNTPHSALNVLHFGDRACAFKCCLQRLRGHARPSLG